MDSTRTLSDTALESNGKPNEQEPPDSDEIGVSDRTGLNKARASSFHARPSSPTSRSRQSSPTHSPRLGRSRLSSSDRSHASSFWDLKELGSVFLWDQKQQLKVKRKAAKAWYYRKRVKGLVGLIGLVGLFFLVNWIMLLRLQDQGVDSKAGVSSSVSIRVCNELCCCINGNLYLSLLLLMEKKESYVYWKLND
jgi:hypothetical protein